MNKEFCECGHSKGRHKYPDHNMNGAAMNHELINCLHCPCKEFALNEEPQEELKESEPKECKHCKKEHEVKDCTECQPAPSEEIEKEVQRRVKQVTDNTIRDHILLPRPKRMSIGEALMTFLLWCENRHDFWRKDDYRMLDQDFLKLWNEWLETMK